MSAPTGEADVLRALSFFSELTDDDLLRVTRIGRRRAFHAGEILIERGSDAGGLFVVLSGRVSVDVGGVTQELGPGEFLGEMALLGGTQPAGTGPDFFGEHPVLARAHRSANVIAVEPVEAFVIETVYFEPFLLENPSVAVAILRRVVGRLRDVQARLERDR